MLWNLGYLGPRSAHLELITHFFDFCLLLFQSVVYCLERNFQLLHFALLFEERLMLPEELIEQHRVYRFIADGVDVAPGVMGHQIGVRLRHLLGHDAELRDARSYPARACNGR